MIDRYLDPRGCWGFMQKICNVGSVCLAVWLLWLAGAQALAAPQHQTTAAPVGVPGDNGQSADGQSKIYPGTATGQDAAPHAGGAADSQGDITLNFVNADVRDVAKAILGDYLKLNYEIGSNVQGLVTIQTNEPLTRAQVLPALEQGLSLNGMVLVRSKGIYKIVPLADAHHELGAAQPATARGASSGYGVEVFHVKYVNAVELLKLLQPLAGTEGSVRADQSRNLLIVEGTAQERQTIAEDIALFDADWLSGMSFALFTPDYMDAEELAKELDHVLGGFNSPIAGVVKLIPIDRLNAVLVISPQPRYLDQLRAWVSRLDKPGQGNDKKIFVYHVQNGRATDLANTLRKTLFGSNETSSREGSDTTQDVQPSITQPANGTASSGNGLAGAHSGTQAAEPSETTEPDQPEGSSQHYETVGGVNRQGMNSVHITADETNNALVILATPREYGVIQDGLHELDTAPVQVLLEASIAEVTLTKETQYGFQYFYKPNGNNTLALSNTQSTANATLSTITQSFPGFSYMFSNGSNIQVILNALGTVTNVNVISSPEVMVLNNQTARLEVGNEVPVLSAQAVSTVGSNAPVVNSVQYIDTGVILKVTPRVNRGGTVMMDVSQEVSGVATDSLSTVDSPTIQQRKINSSVSVADGETVALGGLFTKQITNADNGIPFLQDIPLLGKLFNNTDDTQNKTELMVLITPHVVDDVRKARAVTDELRRKLPEVQALFDQRS